MKKTLLAALCAVSFARLAPGGINIVEDFSTDPISTSRWTFGVGDNSNSQFAWSNTAASHTGDSPGSLAVHLDSGLPTARLQTPIGTTLTQSTDFTLTTQFRFSITQAKVDEGVQIAFGLVNSGLTGGDRTGSFGNPSGADAFHTVEFNYFPNTSTFSASTPGPSLSPAIVGAQKPGNSAFGNFAAHFGEDGDLGGNATGITELPQMVTLQATLDYTAATRIFVLSLRTVNAAGSPALLETGVPPLDLDTQFLYDSAFPFEVDSIAIMAYLDGYANPADPSLIADVAFERFELTSPVPEPSSLLLSCVGAFLIALRRRSA